MMKLNNNRIRGFMAGKRIKLALVALCLSPAAHAALFTYEFNIAYGYNDSPGYFGSAARVAISVDNGGDSNAAQSYAWSDIAYLNVSTVGGSFMLSTQYPPNYFTDSYYALYPITISHYGATDQAVLFNTDQSGDHAVFAATGQTELFGQSRSLYRENYSAQLGAGGNDALRLYGAYYAPYCQGVCWESQAYAQTIAAGLSGTLVTPNPVYLQTVPLPAAGALLSAGLLVLGAMRKKTK